MGKSTKSTKKPIYQLTLYFTIYNRLRMQEIAKVIILVLIISEMIFSFLHLGNGDVPVTEVLNILEKYLLFCQIHHQQQRKEVLSVTIWQVDDIFCDSRRIPIKTCRGKFKGQSDMPK